MKVELFSDFAVVERLKELADELMGHFEWFASEANIAVPLCFLLGAMISLVVGFFGYRLTKAVFAIGFACFGFTVGRALYEFFISKGKPMDNIEFLTSVVGGLLMALICIFLGKKKFTYVMFAGIFIFLATTLYRLTEMIPLAIGLAIIVGLMCILNVRVAVVMLSSFVGAFAAITCISGFFPKAETFAIAAQNNDMGLLIAWGLGLILCLIQLGSAKYFKAEEE